MQTIQPLFHFNPLLSDSQPISTSWIRWIRYSSKNACSAQRDTYSHAWSCLSDSQFKTNLITVECKPGNWLAINAVFIFTVKEARHKKVVKVSTADYLWHSSSIESEYKWNWTKLLIGQELIANMVWTKAKLTFLIHAKWPRKIEGCTTSYTKLLPMSNSLRTAKNNTRMFKNIKWHDTLFLITLMAWKKDGCIRNRGQYQKTLQWIAVSCTLLPKQ